MFHRSLVLPPAGSELFFLWGPRQTGKTTLLRAAYPDARWIDLLKADEFRRYTTRPETMREELEAEPATMVVIDEVQKVPALLDEVHWLHDRRGVQFALCGSSARKVRRGHANLLGGRAVRYELFGLVSAEIGADFDLDRMLNHGYLPRHYLAPSPGKLLRAYVGDYLREEIAAEGLTRSLPAFAAFLDAAALADGQLVNASNIARECGVSNHTVKSYFEILQDTLLGRWLPAFRARPKRRVATSPKFYFADVGVVNVLAKRGQLHAGGELYGRALENWVFHELCAHNEYAGAHRELSYWRTASGFEVDFIVGDMQLAVECKASKVITPPHTKSLRALAEDHPECKRRVVVCLEPRARRTTDGIDILPARTFARRLWDGSLLGD